MATQRNSLTVYPIDTMHIWVSSIRSSSPKREALCYSSSSPSCPSLSKAVFGSSGQ